MGNNQSDVISNGHGLKISITHGTHTTHLLGTWAEQSGNCNPITPWTASKVDMSVQNHTQTEHILEAHQPCTLSFLETENAEPSISFPCKIYPLQLANDLGLITPPYVPPPPFPCNTNTGERTKNF